MWQNRILPAEHDPELKVISIEQWSSLLAKLYAAPLDHLCQLTETSSGYLIDTGSGGNPVVAGGGANYDPSVFQLYADHGADDPYRTPIVEQRRIGLIPGEELVSQEELVKTELYNEVLLRFGLQYNNMLSCTSQGDKVEVLSLWRDRKRGPMESGTNHSLELLVPHMRLALGLRSRFRDLESVSAFSELTLKAMTMAAMVVTCDGKLIHLNAAASKLLPTTKGLRLSHGKIVAVAADKELELRNLIRAATSSNAPAPGGAMRVGNPSDGVVLSVIPLPAENHQATRERCALIFLRGSLNAPAGRGALLQRLYQLSPSEGRLADLLLDGDELKDCAVKLNITVGTARFQLKRIFEKTGTKRQSALMRLMLSLPPTTL